MFLILLHYTQPLNEVDALVPAHRAYLEQHYAAGHFLLSGRKEPRTGGVIMAKADSRREVEAWVAEDPFYIGGVSEYQIIEFLPSMAASQLTGLLAH